MHGLPTFHVPTCFHVGSMDPGRRGTWSLEGQGLSVSLCPDAWLRIARLGGGELWDVSRDGALYLDAHGLDGATLADVRSWAVATGFARHAEVWRLCDWNEEREEWAFSEFATRDAALREAADPDGLVEMEGETSLDALVGESLMRVPGVVLTDAGAARLRGASRSGDATGDLVILWAEDVLAAEIPDLCGVWWTDRYDPDALSAPRGVVFASALPGMTVSRAATWPDDEEEMPDGAFGAFSVRSP